MNNNSSSINKEAFKAALSPKNTFLISFFIKSLNHSDESRGIFSILEKIKLQEKEKVNKKKN